MDPLLAHLQRSSCQSKFNLKSHTRINCINYFLYSKNTLVVVDFLVCVILPLRLNHHDVQSEITYQLNICSNCLHKQMKFLFQRTISPGYKTT